MRPSSANDRVVPRPRRVYTAVAVEEAGDGWRVRLDGKALKTSATHELVVPSGALAGIVAQEWDAQATEVDLAVMPATRLAFTAADRTPSHRAELAEELARYASSDLLAYFADSPTPLVERQRAEWGPLLDWSADSLGVVLERTAGITHRAQPPESLDRARALAAGEPNFALTGLAFACALFGSAVLAFAVRHGRLTGEEAHHLARLDEAFQEQQWGEDAEAAQRTEARRKEAVFAERWFEALS